MGKDVSFNNQARNRLRAGVDLIADAVKATLGPKGRNVVYGFHYGFPVATKDGVTVARQIESADQTEQLGVLLVRQAAQKTADDAGDGTTTASLLVQAIYTEGLRCLNTGANPILIKRGIDKAVTKVLEFIDNNSINIKEESDIFNVATVSANNDEQIGNLIAEAIKKVGENGVVTLEDNYSGADSTVNVVEGMQTNEGMLSPFFMTDTQRLIAEYHNPKILLIDHELSDIMSIAALIEYVIKDKKEPMVIIAHNVIGLALQTLAMSKAQKGIPILACKAAQFGDFRSDLLVDIAALTGATVMGGKHGFLARHFTEREDRGYALLGSCEKITADRFSTTIIGGGGSQEEIDKRIADIDERMKGALSDYDKEKYQERLAKLTSGVAVISVGANSEVEQKEKKMRVEDSLCATKAAIDEGIVAGGGIMYLYASRKLETPSNIHQDEEIGFNIIRKALKEPLNQIARNSGISGEEVMARCSDDNLNQCGYNFLDNKYGNLVKMGIIDPVKVVKNALQNAASVASMLLTTEVCISEVPEEAAPEPARTPKGRNE
jgi:chaperonin GroEL